jgi:spore coat protein U-like protein
VGVIQISIQVLSGLQASYAGPALDFGEIGQVTGAQASSHLVNGQFQVKSSGAFTVALASGNHFLMTYPSGPSTSPNLGTVQYELGFGGQTMSYAQQTFTSLSCHRVGVNTPVFLPIAAKLLDGGQGKTPSPNYQDLLSVTFTPLVDTATGSVDCQSLSAPTP